MILDQNKIVELIKEPKNSGTIARAKALLKSHQLHVQGVGMEDFLYKIQDYENDAQLANRKKTTKPTTVPIFGKELSTFEKIFSAQGFSKYYDVSDQNDFKNYLNDIGEGRSISEWMEQIWLEKVNYDSSGVFLLELPEEIKGKPEPYVTFRSICDFHDFGCNGKKIEYLILVEAKKDKEGDYFEYRVIDDAFDYIVISRNGNIKIQQELTLPNQWGYVPAIFVSNQTDSISAARTSYIWRAIGIADEYLTDSSIHSILKKLHGYPIFWTRERGCKKCNGSGKVNYDIPGSPSTCMDCGGSGFNLKKDVSDGIVIPQLTDPNQQDSLPVAGYVAPEIATLAEQRTELDWLKVFIHLGVWSNEEIESKQTDGTATGRMLDVQATYDKLNLFSKNAEQVELFITNGLGKIRYGDSYKGSSINYGRRYFVRSAYEIEEMYQNAKKAELPNAILSAYREELVYVKFANDPMQLSRQVKLMELEPFTDYTIEQLKSMEVAKEDLFMKVYFNDYILRYEREVKPIVFSEIEEIKIKLMEYNAEKIKQKEATQEPIQIAA